MAMKEKTFTNTELGYSKSADNIQSMKPIPWLIPSKSHDEVHQTDQNAESLQDTHIRHEENTTSIELFYDLFLVANLSAFTERHEINSTSSLQSYIAFFTILWFTWFQTSLFDVRFVADSIFFRICKACSFAIMVGFAVVGIRYNIEDVGSYNSGFKALSLILMASRLILMVQYLVTAWSLRRTKSDSRHFLAAASIELVAALLFLGLSFGFDDNRASKAYAGWFVTLACEAIVMLGMAVLRSGRLSLRKGHFVERLGLLTLIILGENINGLVRSVTKILDGSGSLDAGAVGAGVSTVLITYFIWMLYFDQQIHADRKSTIYLPLWAILHFALHITIVLVGEGASKLILWWIASVTLKALLATLDETLGVTTSISAIDPQTVAIKLNLTFSYYQQDLHGFSEFPNMTQQIDDMLDLPSTLEQATSAKKFGEILEEILNKATRWIFENFQISPPTSYYLRSNSYNVTLNNISEDAADNSAILSSIDTVFVYFYVASGCLLILISILLLFGRKHT
ncbi:hypothetical protein UCRPC4_g00657 [Phaeomoniella chlamydospora]|uniref:Low temperature requirement a n=1 Tax=Phaeomoniella chlamydospora TaxID=158046 RepID=A0A0G2F1K6_PHACM|nr:hypothetical protein UCRPC4_g00657 [Phaeomoniella chlamydospora]